MKIKAANRFQHDCENDCLFLGPYNNDGVYYDLYVHQDALNKIDTVIARYGSEPSYYISGVTLVRYHPELLEALNRAKMFGLTENQKIKTKI